MNIQKAHFVGLSMGGFIAQLIALHYPQYVISATIMMSTSDYSILLDTLCGKPSSNPVLSPPKKEFMEAVSRIDPKLPEIDRLLENWRAMNGPQALFDENFWYALLKRAAAREKHFGGKDGIHNHRRAALRTKTLNLIPLLGRMTPPLLVIQGMEDPIFPSDHGEATQKACSRAKLLKVEKMGHVLNPEFYDPLLSALLDHFVLH